MAVGLGVKSGDQLIPYMVPPDDVRPSVVTTFATTCRECPAGCGMHLWHRDGRVTKAEGNPLHPINRGTLCARGQSALQGLYDPDRLRQVLRRPRGGKAEPVAWLAAIEAIGRRIQAGKGRVAILSDLQVGALAEVMDAVAAAFGGPRPVFFEPFHYEPLRAAHAKVFGLPVVPEYRIEECEFILSFGADFLETWVSPVGYANRFARSHAYADGRRGRLVYVGPRLSMTAANADDLLRVSPGAMRNVALAMLRTMVERGWGRADEKLKALVASLPAGATQTPDVPAATIERLTRGFVEARGSAALAGPVGASGPAAEETAVAAALLNWAAGRIGQTVDFSRPHALSRAATSAEWQGLLSGLTPDDVLIIHAANPAYAGLGAAGNLAQAGEVIYLGTMMDETAGQATWVLPVDSPLESWGDYEPSPGIHGLMQPTMSRLYDTRSAGDVLLSIARAAGKPLLRPVPAAPVRRRSEAPAPAALPVPPASPVSGEAARPTEFEIWLRERWAQLRRWMTTDVPADAFWKASLRAGGAWEEPFVAAPPKPAWDRIVFSSPPAPAGRDGGAADGAAELWAWPSVMLFDGRVANRGWLQEAPEPVSSLAWGSWVDVHPESAKSLGVASGDVVELATAAGKVQAPVRVTDDVAPGVVALAFGQGHTALGRNAAGRGANAFALLGGDPAGGFGRVTVRPVGRREAPAGTTSGVQDQSDRRLLQWVDFDEVRRMKPGEGTPVILPLPEGYRPDKDLYPPRHYAEHRWAMAADLDRCTGCGACAVACYAENNVSVVGGEHTARGRDLRWLQVVPYRDPADGRRVGFLPLMCQHCDAAPCEAVCPTFASVHSEEGLNAQIYNRCVGTRYCANNCPYKVRRFNWLNVAWEKPLDAQLNPEVTVRVRGVMEKCTFCIQRIRQAQYRARREGRRVRDGDIRPACVQTCPTQALVFGDLLDPASRVTDLTRRDPRRYHVLEDLNTKPGVTYLRRVRPGGATT